MFKLLTQILKQGKKEQWVFTIYISEQFAITED